MNEQSLTAFDPIKSEFRPPFYRRTWFLILCVLLFVPLQLLIMWTGPIYLRRKGVYVPVGRGSKVFMSILGIVLLSFNVAVFFGGDASGKIPACGDEAAITALKGALEGSPGGKAAGLKVLDVEKASELSWSEAAQTRNCEADVFTNGGEHRATYQMRWVNGDHSQFYLEAQSQ